MKESDSMHFRLYEQAPVGFIRLDGQGLISDANLITAILLGVARVTMLRQPLTRFIYHEDHEIYSLHHHRLLETGKMHKCDLRMKKRDGSLFHGRLEATAAQCSSGAPEYRALLSAVASRDMSR